MASLLLCLSSWRMRFLLTWRFWSPLWWALSSQRKEFRSEKYLTVFVYHLVSIYTGIFILNLTYSGFYEHLASSFFGDKIRHITKKMRTKLPSSMKKTYVMRRTFQQKMEMMMRMMKTRKSKGKERLVLCTVCPVELGFL